MKAKQDVNSFVNALNHPQENLINLVRDCVKESNAALVEGIKWNAPSYSLNENDIITFNFRTYNCISLILHTGPKGKDTHTGIYLFEDKSGLVEWVADKRLLLKIEDEEYLHKNKDKIKDLINKWIKYANINFNIPNI